MVNSGLPKRVAENIDQFIGRAWLLPKLLEWWDKRKDERIFLLTGGPGTGKSMILAWLAGFGPEPEETSAKEQLSRIRKVFKAAHFCQAASRNITPQAFAENIANQLTGSVKGFGDALAATLAERVQIIATQTVGTIGGGGSATNVSIARIDLATLGDELSFDRAFTQPLKKLYASGYTEPMLLLVDALDEADTYTGVKIPDLLSCLSDLPPPIRILATTRDEPRVLEFFRDLKHFDLIADAAADVDDVRVYSTGRLMKLASVDVVKRGEFAKRLAEQAEGVFLYAAMVLDELLDRAPSGLPDLDLYPLPDGLSGLYQKFLTRELGKDDPRWFDLYEPLLGLIAVAQGEGLTAQQLTDIIAKDIRLPLRACKQYLNGELPNGPFHLFHKSFADFLLEEKKNVDRHIDSREMHRRIAEHYWSKHAEWQTCDDYGLAYLSKHLYQARQFERLAELISVNWMHARVQREDYRYDGFLADLMLAWQNAHARGLADIDAGNEPANLADCLRYALIRTSITSLSSRYEPELMKRAVKTGLWSIERAMSVANKVLQPRDRARMFQEVLDACPNETARRRAASKALPEVRAMQDQEARTIAFRALARHLLGSEKAEALHEAREAAQKNEDLPGRIEALAMLSPLLSETEAKTTLDAAVSILETAADKEMRSARTQMPGLPNTAWSQALDPLVEQLKDGLLLARVLSRVRRIDNMEDRAPALATLAVKLSGEEKEAALVDGVSAAFKLEDESSQVHALAALAPHLTGTLLAKVLARASLMQDSWWRAKLMNALAQAGGPDKKERLRKALSTAKDIEDQAVRAEALAGLAPQLEGGLLTEAFSAAGEIQDARSRIEALATIGQQFATLGQQFAEPEQESCLGTALALMQEDVLQGAQLLIKLAPILSAPLAFKALLATKDIEDARQRVNVFAELLPKLTGTEQTACLQDIVKLITAEQTGRGWSQVLRAVAPYLSGQLLTEVLAAQKFEDDGLCAGALTALAQDLQGFEKESVLRDALESITRISNVWARARELTRLAPQLSGALGSKALVAARAIHDTEPQLKAQAAIAWELSGKEKEEVLVHLAEAVPAAMKIKPDRSRADVLAALAPHLSGDVKESVVRGALEAVRGIEGLVPSEGDEDRAEVLAAIGPHLSGSVLHEALALVRQMRFGKARAKALAALAGQMTELEKETALRDELNQVSAAASAPCQEAVPENERQQNFRRRFISQLCAEELIGLAPLLSGTLLADALSQARQMEGKVEKAAVLIALARRMMGDGKEIVAREALSAAMDIDSAEPRAAALAALAPEVGEPEKGLMLTHAMAAAEQCKGDEPLMAALVAISPQLSGPLLARAFGLAKGIRDERCQTVAVEAIATSAQEGEDALQEIRRYMMEYLWSTISQKGQDDAYEFCRRLCHPPLVSIHAVEATAKHIGEIGLRWTWT